MRRAARPIESDPAMEAIWHVVSLIPQGQYSTYGDVARAAGLPGRARLAGRALKNMPPDLHLPWHRVLGAGGRIVFPEGSRHFREQASRLKAEGVAVKKGKADPAALAVLGEM